MLVGPMQSNPPPVRPEPLLELTPMVLYPQELSLRATNDARHAIKFSVTRAQ